MPAISCGSRFRRTPEHLPAPGVRPVAGNKKFIEDKLKKFNRNFLRELKENNEGNKYRKGINTEIVREIMREILREMMKEKSKRNIGE